MRRKEYVQRAVLSALKVGGILALAAVAPNTLQYLGRLDKGNSRFVYQTRSVLSRLTTKGYVRFTEHNGVRCVELTRDGMRHLHRETLLSRMQAGRKRRWDGRWRIVMFDVPEKRKRDRERLRYLMKEAGFVLLQESVWTYPHDCEEFVALLKIEMRLGNNLRYAIIEKLEDDAALKKTFGLST